MKASIHLRLRRGIQALYWNIMKRVNRLAYLHYVVDNAEDLCDCIEDAEEILCRETDIWTKRGYRVHASIGDIPLPEGRKAHWEDGSWGWGRYVDWDTLRKFKKIVEDAEYERSKRKWEGREIWIKWFTATVAAVAALASLLNLYLSYRTKK